MFEAIKLVGSGLSLVAFAIAAILYAYRARLNQRAKLIQSAAEGDRLEAIATTAEFFRVDVSGLSRVQKQEIVLAQIRLRSRRDSMLAIIAILVAVLLAMVAIFFPRVPSRTFTATQTRMRLNLDLVKVDPSWIGIPTGTWHADRQQWLSTLNSIDTTDDAMLKRKVDELISIISKAPKSPAPGLSGEDVVSIPEDALLKFREMRLYIKREAISAGLTPD
jgi:hypothetical protein